jgi:3D (Asp-Asp-Asp) domain-containing protein
MFARLLASIFRLAPLATLRRVARGIGAKLRSSFKYINSIGISLITGAACQSGISPKVEPIPDQVSVVDDSIIETEAPKGARSLGNFHLTFYYVIGEDEVVVKPEPENAGSAAGSNGQNDPSAVILDNSVNLAAVVPPSRVTLYSGGADCQPIANVTHEFASEIEMQGTGKLRDGRIVNIWGACNCEHSPCYKVTGNQWGNAGSGRPLAPFRTVAVDPKIVPLGTLLFIPALEGRRMPGRAPWGGFVHDGCVVADDTGGGIDGHQLDFFVGRKSYYHALSSKGGSHSWARSAEVFDGSKQCERKDGKVNHTAPETL